MTASPAAVAAAQKPGGCQESQFGPWCIAHSHLKSGQREWTDRGCAFAVAVADAVVKATDEVLRVFRDEPSD